MAKTGKIILKAPESRHRKIAGPMTSPARTDRFLITSMLLGDYPSSVTISEDTIIGGSTVNSVMELGRCELCSDMKLNDCLNRCM